MSDRERREDGRRHRYLKFDTETVLFFFSFRLFFLVVCFLFVYPTTTPTPTHKFPHPPYLSPPLLPVAPLNAVPLAPAPTTCLSTPPPPKKKKKKACSSSSLPKYLSLYARNIKYSVISFKHIIHLIPKPSFIYALHCLGFLCKLPVCALCN